MKASGRYYSAVCRQPRHRIAVWRRKFDKARRVPSTVGQNTSVDVLPESKTNQLLTQSRLQTRSFRSQNGRRKSGTGGPQRRAGGAKMAAI
jgi:hypothetical protein